MLWLDEKLGCGIADASCHWGAQWNRHLRCELTTGRDSWEPANGRRWIVLPQFSIGAAEVPSSCFCSRAKMNTVEPLDVPWSQRRSARYGITYIFSTTRAAWSIALA